MGYPYPNFCLCAFWGLSPTEDSCDSTRVHDVGTTKTVHRGLYSTLLEESEEDLLLSYIQLKSHGVKVEYRPSHQGLLYKLSRITASQAMYVRANLPASTASFRAADLPCCSSLQFCVFQDRNEHVLVMEHWGFPWL